VLSGGRMTDPRLTAGPAGASETAPADGGFLVQKDFASELWMRAYDTGDILSRCKKIPIGEKSNGVKINAIDEDSRADGSRWGGVLAYWANEAQTATKSKPKFRQIEIQLNKLIALVYATDELLEDGAALEAVIQEGFTQEMTFRTEDAIFNGTGAGQPLGFLNSGALISQLRTTANTIVTADILAMWSRMWGRSRKTAAWFIDQSIEQTLYPLTLGAPSLGQVLMFKPADRDKSTQPWGSMMGAPVIPTEHGAALGTQGDIVLCDMSQYLMGDKGGVRQDYSIHVNFLSDEGVFRFVYRVDGQPAWKAPLTPKSGGNTVSAFVALSAST
jgi:HK97 family phage major capsid protein